MAQGWHPNPQLMQPPHQAPPPQGWTGSWPPGGQVVLPPGYPGPPPMPGETAGHPRWNAGYWQYNPLANIQNPQQPWAPGVGWSQPNFNPYKRVPKPPSPSYWNTQLSENGLGLEGMVKRKDPSEYNGEEPQTPWIWNPASLLEAAGDRATPTRDFNPRRSGSGDNSLHTVTTPTRDHGRSSRGSSQDSPSVQPHSQTPERRSSSRTNYFYNSQDNSAAPTRHSFDSSDLRPSRSTGAVAGPSTSSQRSTSQTDSWPNRTRSQPVANEVPPYPAPTPTIRSASAQQLTFTQEPETFTSRGELHPTFSSSVIRTPIHYQQARRSTDESSHHSRSPSSAVHTSTPSRGPPVPEPLTRQSSLPNASSSTRDVYTNFSEDLSHSLVANTSSRTRSSATAGTLSRSRTEPVVANLTTIHESSSTLSSGEIFLAPLRDTPCPSSTESSPDPSPRRRDKRTSPYGSHPHSPEPSPGLYRDRRPSPYASRHANPQSRGHSHSPSPLASPHVRDPHVQGASSSSSAARRDNSNPLPTPPVERANPEASRPPFQEPSPPRYARKLRMGFWNKRGDHLTPNSFVVYAPHDRAYPEELRDYPDEREGYRDQFGTFVTWREERPELPASLPRRGRPPAQPYDTFVVYTYLQ
ncbi:hypothetical protein EV363DRAFT_1253460 [Boletus edulis]|nr:hypothetical protein EV363DRAFT_1253460 [Boletus edulis]